MCQCVEINVTLKQKHICARFMKHFYFYGKDFNLCNRAPDRQDVLNQACNHKRAYLFWISLWKHSWILRQKWQNYLILPRFSNKKRLSNKKEYCSCEIAATHAGFGHVQVGMATKTICFDFCFFTWLVISASCELEKSLKTRLENRFRMQQFVNGKCTSFTTLMELLNTLLFVVCGW